ncbi:MAG: putative DNA modification/repair radical SAM protein [Clostridium sp.]
MDTMEKLKILSNAAKYDVSCSSSGSKRKNTNNGLGDASSSGICHSFTPDGRCVSLLKILLSNDCVYDCKYCINAYSKDVPRATFTVEEIVSLTINFYKRNYIEGLFLSSGIYKNPNHTMEMLTQVVKTLRLRENFNGYIHLKGIPGADEALIKEAGKYVDRMSVNIELPSSTSLKLLAPQKTKTNILKPMSLIKNSIDEHSELKKNFRKAPLFVPGGQSTQLIIGATPEKDGQILNLSQNLYDKFKLKRVYYSAYVPVIKDNPLLPSIEFPPTLREHRLYQADWLLRYYGFNSRELLKEDEDFDLKFDPKTSWALKNINHFPVEINRCSYDDLLRIPGIGVTSAKRILKARRLAPLNFMHLKKIGVVLKRAQYFITCMGKYYGDVSFDKDKIENRLSNSDVVTVNSLTTEQLSFFTSTETQIALPKSKIPIITGQI